MKKILTILMVLCLSLGILAGCGDNADTPASTGGKKTFVFGDTILTQKMKNPTSTPITPIPVGPASVTAWARR